jgi:hypothetical protein
MQIRPSPSVRIVIAVITGAACGFLSYRAVISIASGSWFGAVGLLVALAIAYMGLYYLALEIYADEANLNLVSIGRRHLCPRLDVDSVRETRDGRLVVVRRNGTPAWHTLSALWRKDDIQFLKSHIRSA